jgi:hypothetical protein
VNVDEPEVIPLTVITREPSDEELLAEIEALATVSSSRGLNLIALYLRIAADVLRTKRPKDPT